MEAEQAKLSEAEREAAEKKAEDAAMYAKLQEIQKLGQMTVSQRAQPRVELSRARWMRNYVAGIPERPEPVQLKNAYHNALDLAWYPSNCHRAAIHSYHLRMDDILVYDGPCITFKMRDLKSKTKYAFDVAAVNACGVSLFSFPVTFETIPGPPGAPEPPEMVETSQRYIVVKWTPPWDGGSPVTSYKLYVNERPRYTGADLSAKMEGLLEAQTYRFRVQALNDFGIGAFSQEAFIKTLAGPPDIPTALELKDQTFEKVDFLWKAAPRAGATIDFFEVWVQNVTKAEPDPPWILEYTGLKQLYVKTGLRPFTKYRFKVYAVNDIGKSLDGDILTVVTGTAPPEKTTDLRCVHASSRHLAIEWRIPFENGERITHFELKMNGVEVYNGSENRVRIKGLEPAGFYVFKVTSVNACGPGEWSNEAGFRCDDTNYDLWTCGANPDGRCGLDPGRNNEESILLVPRRTLYYDQFQGVRAVSCGNKHTHVVTWDGKIWAWGSGEFGKLGLGGGSNTPEPRMIESLGEEFFIEAAAGYDHSAFLTDMGRVYTCGRGDEGQLGHGNNIRVNPAPFMVEELEESNVVHVATGSNFTGFLTASGKVYTCGDGNAGRLGHGNETGCSLPTLVRKFDEDGIIIHALDCGGNHTVVVSQDGEPYSWGYNNTGQLGTGNTETSLEPVKMKGCEGLFFQQCATGGSHTAISTEEGKVYTCGWAMFCGRAETENTHTPTLVEKMDGKRVRQLVCGRSQTAAVTDCGEIWNWGIGACGQLGHGDDEDRLEPTLVESIQSEGACKLSCGSLHLAVVTSQKQNQLLVRDGTPEGMDGLTARDREGRTVLQRAVLTNNMTVTKWLVDNNANVKTQNNKGETVLHTSVHCGLDDVLNYLLHVTSFEVFDTKDNEGRDVLELAMLLRQRQVALTLINYFGKNYARGRCMQGVAACNNDVDLLQVAFSDQQSDAEADLLYNRNPLYWAVAFGRIDATKLLVTNKNWVNERDFVGQSPLYVAFNGDTPEHVECARVLLQNEARVYFPVPDHYGKQPGDYAKYPPLVELQKEFVQISLVTDYNYNPRVIDIDQLRTYKELAKVCKDVSQSQRDAKHMILQIDVEGDNELDVNEETIAEFIEASKAGVAAVPILITPSTEYDPPVPDECQWEQQFWTDVLPRYGGVDIACEMSRMEELDYSGVITELMLQDRENAVYNKMMEQTLEDDIQVLTQELKQKSDLLEGLKEDLEEATEKAEEVQLENAEVDRLFDAMKERLDFYDNQVESWEGRLRGGSFDSDRGRDSDAQRGSVAAGGRNRKGAQDARPVGEDESGTCVVS